MLQRLLILLLACFIPLCANAVDWKAGNVLVGYGTSIPGFGDTTERVQTADLLFRWETVRKQYEGEDRTLGATSHQFWMEGCFSALLKDSDSLDNNDYGLASFSFLSAWTFESNSELQPYVFVGGGPVFVAADIRGVGSDFCGNYQAGVGVKGLSAGNRDFEFQIKYHHISNLNTASPNVALNSIKLYFSIPF